MKPSVHPFVRLFRPWLVSMGGIGLLLSSGAGLKAGSLQAVVMSRQGLKGIQGVHFGSFGEPTINDAGAISVYASVYGKGVDSTTNTLIALVNRSGTARKMIRKGDATGNGYVFSALGTDPVVNNSRHVSWTAEYVDIDNTHWFRIALGNPNGTSSRYAGRNVTWYVDGMPELALNVRNATCVNGMLLDPISGDYLSTVFRLTLSVTTAIVTQGDPPIGMPLGSTYNSFGVPTIDDKNNLYFVADISDSGNAFDGIWFGKNADPGPLVVKGQSATGTSSTFSTFSDSPCPSPDGTKCAFTASAGGTNNGVWVADTASKAVSLIATTTSRVDGSSEQLSNFQPPALNNKGQVAFVATSSVTSKSGVYAWNGAKLIKVIGVGDTVNINGKDKKVIDIRFNPVHALNSSGVVAFTASFDDRTSGVFKAAL